MNGVMNGLTRAKHAGGVQVYLGRLFRFILERIWLQANKLAWRMLTLWPDTPPMPLPCPWLNPPSVCAGT